MEPLPPSLYPQTYKTSFQAALNRGVKTLIVVALAFLSRTHIGPGSPRIILGIGFVFCLFVIFRHAFVAVTLYPDRIECETGSEKRVMYRHEIEGWRNSIPTFSYFTLLSGKIPALIYKDYADFPFALPVGIVKDEAWIKWMEEIPDLDARDKVTILTDLSEYPKLGATEQTRQATLRRAQRIANICFWGAFFLGFWALIATFMPPVLLTKGVLSLLMVLPWIILLNMYVFGATLPGAYKNHVALFFSALTLALFGGVQHANESEVATLLSTKEFYWIAAPLCGLPLLAGMMAIVFSAPKRREVMNACVVMLFLFPLLLLLSWGYGLGVAQTIESWRV